MRSCRAVGASLGTAVVPLVLVAACVLPFWARAEDFIVSPDGPNAISFPVEQVRFVRFVSFATNSSSQPCIDELEVFAPESDVNLALAETGSEATASSCMTGHGIHKIPHLNDGKYGNSFSWIAAGQGEEWAQIELPEAMDVARVVFSRDRTGSYADRIPVDYALRLSTDGENWTTVKNVVGQASLSSHPGVVPGPPPPPRPGASSAVLLAILRDGHVPRHDPRGLVNLALHPQAKPAASSAYPGNPAFTTAHLNDGRIGPEHGWVSDLETNRNGAPVWAEVDLGGVFWIDRVVLGGDSTGQIQGRAPETFSILTATQHASDCGADTWTTVYTHTSGKPVQVRRAFHFKPVQARWVRIAIRPAELNPRLEEIEVYGQTDPIPGDLVSPPTASVRVTEAPPVGDTPLRMAFLGEEHAWLKTYGRADLSPRLVPYNGRVQKYPRHKGDDRLPLPHLSDIPVLDGSLDDPCWLTASRGIARVAAPDDIHHSPLADYAVTAGWRGDRLYLAVETNRLLSSHLVVLSTLSGKGRGVLVFDGQSLAFNTYRDKSGCQVVDRSTPVDGAFTADFTCFEVGIPLALFPECQQEGLRAGLGMGGRHTSKLGRPVDFIFAPLAIAEAQPFAKGLFRVRMTAATNGPGVELRTNAPDTEDSLRLAPGESTEICFPARRNDIGPEFGLSVQTASGEPYRLHLFRYDPLSRTLALMEELATRLEAKGLDVAQERREWERLRERHARLFSADTPDPAAERQALHEARQAKRRLLFREPDLAPMAHVLFVKRHAFRPSHNYSVILDAPYRPGGGIYTMRVPRREGRLVPEETELTRLFNAGDGIARTPMADFDLRKVYFAYRPSPGGYFHVMGVNLDGSQLTQLTNGPFHDYWPCPLPKGGLAFITTRCRARYLCWRPQAAVMFRMDTDGENMRPLSFANLTEWAPSVMNDGRIIWTRSEYIDKGADFGHTLWAIRPDGTKPELVFGNTIIQPNGYANGREVPGTNEIACTLISHFGDLNGPIALLDIDKGRFNPKAITSITPEVPWPGMWPMGECFRDPVPLASDYFLCSHAPAMRFGIFVIDRFGNRELVYTDPDISSMCPTPLEPRRPSPMLADLAPLDSDYGEFTLVDVYRGIEPAVKRGDVKYVRVVEEVRAGLEQEASGEYRKDHEPFMNFYASPVDLVSGPYGWPTYVAKAPHGIVPVEPDGSARFRAPAGKVLYFQILDKDFNELQRMRSVVQLQPGEARSCIGCHEHRQMAPPNTGRPIANIAREPEVAPWGGAPFSFEKTVQPVLDANCVRCHDTGHAKGLDFTGRLDKDRVPVSYRTLIANGLVHYCDYGWNSGGCEKLEPLTFGTVQSALWKVLDTGHKEVNLTKDEMRRIKTWIDLNCPLWGDYKDRSLRPGLAEKKLAGAG